MPTLPIIAVFYSDQEWVKWKFADGSISSACPFLGVIQNISSIDMHVWMALLPAIRNPNTWVEVN